MVQKYLPFVCDENNNIFLCAHSGILPMECDQETVFRKVGQEAVQNALDGFNSTIFAYGQVKRLQCVNVYLCTIFSVVDWVG